MEIKKKQFWGDKSLRSYVVPSEVRTIGDWAFAGCRELVRIALPRGIEQIGRDAFQGCDKLEEAFVSHCEGSFCEATAWSEAERAGAGLMALALRYFPDASKLFAAMREGNSEWIGAWDEACKKFLEEEEAVGFKPFLAGGEEDYEDAAKALEEYCRKKRMIKAEMIYKRLAVMEICDPLDAAEGHNGSGCLRNVGTIRTFYEERLRENDMALEYLLIIRQRPSLAVQIYDRAGVLTSESIQKLLAKIPEEKVELRAALLRIRNANGNSDIDFQQWML